MEGLSMNDDQFNKLMQRMKDNHKDIVATVMAVGLVLGILILGSTIFLLR